MEEQRARGRLTEERRGAEAELARVRASLSEPESEASGDLADYDSTRPTRPPEPTTGSATRAV
jgi:hypothetical protein